MLSLIYKFNCLKWYWKLPVFLLLLLILSNVNKKNNLRYKRQITKMNFTLNNIAFEKIVKTGKPFPTKEIPLKSTYYDFIGYFDTLLKEYSFGIAEVKEDSSKSSKLIFCGFDRISS